MISGQYSYLLTRKFFQLTKPSDKESRIYLQSMSRQLLKDPGLQINGEIYQEVCNLLEEIQLHLYHSDLVDYSDIFTHDIFPTLYNKGQQMFNLLGIEFYFSEPISSSSTLNFKTPSGQTIVVTSPKITFNLYMYITQEYFMQIYPYYFFTPKESDLNLLNMQTNIAGKNTYWNYDAEKQIITLNGEDGGEWVKYTLWSYFGITNIKAFVIGSNIKYFRTHASYYQNMTIVDLHDPDDEIVFETNWLYNTSKNTGTYHIYTNNHALQNHVFPSDVTVILHPLSDWKGEI